MKKLKQFVAVAVLGTLGTTQCVNADDSMATPPQGDLPDAPLYRANEFSLDVFGSGSIGQQTIDNLSGDRIRHNGRLGAGAGLNYFITRYFGVSADAYTENAGHSFVDSTSGNLVARLPLGESGFAPYLFGGGGYQFDEVEQSFGQGGAGLEFRFLHDWGIFVDARYVIADKTDNYGVARAGLRLSF